MRIQLADIQKRITRRDDRVFGIINYDKDNAYPQRVQDIVNGSGVAKSCIDIFFKFINGKGFNDEAFGDTVIDGYHLTADKLLRANARDFANRKGFAIHFNYNVMGDVTTVNYIPFAHCRLAVDEKTGAVCKIAVYDDWARERKNRINKKDIDYIHLYDPRPEVVQAQIKEAGSIEKYKGQIYYYGEDGELIYPLTHYDSELEDIETDSQVKMFKYRNISGSFMASHMLVMYGQAEGSGRGTGSSTPPLGGERVPYGNPNQEDEIVSQLKQFQGAQNFNRIMKVEIDSPEQKPELVPFTHQNNDTLFEYHEKSTQDNIRKVFAIPTVFLEAVPGKLGLSEELADAVTFYNKMTQDERAILEEAYQMVLGPAFPNRSFKIQPLDFIDGIN